ncbi:glycogen debranching enzyme GlgX [bacterium]|nr:glycogen debranching enzyme GlgX [bacterium]
MTPLKLSRGKCLPLGATPTNNGINFALLCRHGTEVHLALFKLETKEPIAEIVLHPQKSRTGDHWHIAVEGLPDSFCYGWRVNGPQSPIHKFNPEHLLLDPMCKIISGGSEWGLSEESNANHTNRLSIYTNSEIPQLEDTHLCNPMEDSIIYEIHVRGFTCHPTSMTVNPGTFDALIEKIPYLKNLGITAVELLPIHEFDENDCPFFDPATGEKHRNFWGYNSISFNAPKSSYASAGKTNHHIVEFRKMVNAFHKAGIEVIMDVVFNHTGEGNERGRTYNFRGLDNSTYYMVDREGNYFNFSGCGNTLNCNHPIVREMIINSLRFWVADMNVDGLRFDLASILGRDYLGNVLVEPPVVEMIAEDGVLADTKLIAEPWDAAGLYQVGLFPFGRRWSEWNGKFRDDVRRFWRGEPGLAPLIATRICGSSDLYESTGRKPRHSINFITCHDGFTLWDLVSYNVKHNFRNGEGNNDGCNENYSWNCGEEGPTNDPFIIGLRKRQVRNFYVTLFVSQGVPMILAGDEFLRSQKGNNNAWCQDNDISWVDWTYLEKNSDFHRFTQEIIKLRLAHPALRRRTFMKAGNVIWHGLNPLTPDFSTSSTFLAFALNGLKTGRETDVDFFVAMNSGDEPAECRIPVSPTGRSWRRIIDTAKASPLDIVEFDEAPKIAFDSIYAVEAKSCLVLLSEK